MNNKDLYINEIKHEKLLDLREYTKNLIDAISDLQIEAKKEITTLSPEMKSSLQKLSKRQNEACLFILKNIRYFD